MTAAEPHLPLKEDQPLRLDALSPCDKRATDRSDSAEQISSVEPLKIALLGYRSHPFVGGQGIYLKYLSRALAQLGHHVDVFSGPPYPELDQGIGLIKIPSLDLFESENHTLALRPKHLRSFSDTFEWWSMLTGGFAEPYTFGRRASKRLRNSGYDIIHDNQSLSYGLLELQNRGLNVITTIHHPVHLDRDIALQAAEKWGDRLLIRRWYSFLNMQEKVVRKLDNVITVSVASQRDINTYFCRRPSRTPVIPNGVDTAMFRPKDNIARQKRRIITTSSSDQALKGLKFLLQAIAKLRVKYPDIELRIIGKLKEGGSSETLINTLDIQSCVSCISGISTQDLVDEYAQASVAVCPSLYEGFGLPVAEAMACALPVICSDGGALPEVAGDAGIIVPAGDSSSIVNEIDTLFSDSQNATDRGKLSREHVVNNFSWQRVATDLSRHYQNILAHANA